MINHMNQNENTQNKFSFAMNDFKMAGCFVSPTLLRIVESLLSLKVTTAFEHLTRPERVKVFLLDDSIIKRSCSKKVELPVRVYDHVGHKFQI